MCEQIKQRTSHHIDNARQRSSEICICSLSVVDVDDSSNTKDKLILQMINSDSAIFLESAKSIRTKTRFCDQNKSKIQILR
jgi:hypothetical protein